MKSPSARSALQGLPRRLANPSRVHLPRALAVSAEQGAIADDVDQARDAAGAPVDRPQRAGGEQAAASARDPQPVADVGGSLLGVQGGEVVAGGDALGQLPQIRPRQQGAQFRLADQDDPQ